MIRLLLLFVIATQSAFASDVNSQRNQEAGAAMLDSAIGAIDNSDRKDAEIDAFERKITNMDYIKQGHDNEIANFKDQFKPDEIQMQSYDHHYKQNLEDSAKIIEGAGSPCKEIAANRNSHNPYKIKKKRIEKERMEITAESCEKLFNHYRCSYTLSPRCNSRGSSENNLSNLRSDMKLDGSEFNISFTSRNDLNTKNITFYIEDISSVQSLKIINFRYKDHIRVSVNDNVAFGPRSLATTSEKIIRYVEKSSRKGWYKLQFTKTVKEEHDAVLANGVKEFLHVGERSGGSIDIRRYLKNGQNKIEFLVASGNGGSLKGGLYFSQFTCSSWSENWSESCQFLG